ncbi:MAG: chorismate synthase [Chloroflexi bacterium]|nr:chorismate synthase [Chloroflexota bacterium]
MGLKSLTFLTAGESHGQQLTIMLQNMPAGLELSADDVNEQLRRRQGGYGRGGRQKIERDRVQFVGGVRHGYTLGSPIAMVVPNLDWPNWAGRMDVERPPDSDGDAFEPTPKVTRLRPGHADMAGVVKYGFDDVRNVLERASSRETASRVAAGAVARVFLRQFGVEIRSHTVQIGPIEADVTERIRHGYAGSADPEIAAFWERVEESEVRCGDVDASVRMIAEIDKARKDGDTLGGIFEVVAYDLPIGLGSYSQWDEKLDGRLGGALMSIPSIKGVEVGDGFGEAARRGSTVHDVIEYDPAHGWSRRTNNAGGTEGGVSNGAPLVVRCAAKPISTLIKPLPSVDLATRQESPAHFERSDICVIPAAGVVGEAMVALVLADAFRQKFGGDSMAEIRQNYEAYVSTYRPA